MTAALKTGGSASSLWEPDDLIDDLNDHYKQASNEILRRVQEITLTAEPGASHNGLIQYSINGSFFCRIRPLARDFEEITDKPSEYDERKYVCPVACRGNRVVTYA